MQSLKPLLVLSGVVAVFSIAFLITRAESSVVALPELTTPPAVSPKQVERAIPSEGAQLKEEEIAEKDDVVSSREEHGIDWEKIALDDTGETLGSRRSAFTAGFGASLKESMRE